MMREALQHQSPELEEAVRITNAFGEVADSPRLALLHRYEARLHQMYQRALRNLLLVRKSLPGRPETLPPASIPDPLPSPAPPEPPAPPAAASVTNAELPNEPKDPAVSQIAQPQSTASPDPEPLKNHVFLVLSPVSPRLDLPNEEPKQPRGDCGRSDPGANAFEPADLLV
jgi:hypothetical protein